MTDDTLRSQILSDSEKRAEYDNFLFSRRQLLQKQTTYGNSSIHTFKYGTVIKVPKEPEVAEWLQWYRHAVQDIISERKVASGTGYWGELENDLYSAVRAAYYGPEIESSAFLPDCFEAEERSIEQTPEVLHLVSGRDLLGIVCVSDDVSMLPHGSVGKLNPNVSQFCENKDTVIMPMPASPDGSGDREFSGLNSGDYVPDAYRDLEVHISGQLIATASRDPPGCSEDCIHVRLGSHRQELSAERKDSSSTSAEFSNLLGTIRGLGTTSEEGSCDVYDRNGSRTHVIMIHRTLLV